MCVCVVYTRTQRYYNKPYASTTLCLSTRLHIVHNYNTVSNVGNTTTIPGTRRPPPETPSFRGGRLSPLIPPGYQEPPWLPDHAAAMTTNSTAILFYRGIVRYKVEKTTARRHIIIWDLNASSIELSVEGRRQNNERARNFRLLNYWRIIIYRPGGRTPPPYPAGTLVVFHLQNVYVGGGAWRCTYVRKCSLPSIISQTTTRPLAFLRLLLFRFPINLYSRYVWHVHVYLQMPYTLGGCIHRGLPHRQNRTILKAFSPHYYW